MPFTFNTRREPVISITLPSIYPKALKRALDNIEDATRYPCQIIVVSPERPDWVGRGVHQLLWLPDTIMTGCNAAHMMGARLATGTFITGWVDDHFYVDGWDLIAASEFVERERAFHVEHPGKPFELGLRHVWPTHVGTEFGIYYPYFPFMRLADVKKIGWLTDDYRTGFADSDLAMRVWSSGGRCEWSSERIICVHADDGRKNGAVFKPEDMTLFIERWAPRYGEGWDVSHLRGFNIDIEPEKYPDLVADRSITYGKPDFRDIALAGGWRP